MKANKLDRHASKVVAALVYMGCYTFVLRKVVDHVEITSLPLASPYTKLLVYDDGIVHYYRGGSLQFEGNTKRRTMIIMDIEHK